jgi:hypothetical protein
VIKKEQRTPRHKQNPKNILSWKRRERKMKRQMRSLAEAEEKRKKVEEEKRMQASHRGKHGEE